MDVVLSPQDLSVQNNSLAPWGHLLTQLKLLFITGNDRPGDWLAEALAADSGSQVQLEQVPTLALGLARLRNQVFDAVLINHDSQDHDALSALQPIRTGSSDEQPIIVLGRLPAEELSVFCYEAGGDAYLCVENTTTRWLLWEIARAVQRHQLAVEKTRLQQLSHQRLRLEQDETGRLLQQQRALVFGDESDCFTEGAVGRHWSKTYLQSEGDPLSLAAPLIAHYRELLRTYVIMGSGNLSQELAQLARQLVNEEVTAQQVMTMHLFVVEEMVQGLGSRSARHLMNRADLLIVEIMIHLVDHYRNRSAETGTESPCMAVPKLAG